jgi:hypothetical protein
MERRGKEKIKEGITLRIDDDCIKGSLGWDVLSLINLI